MIAFQGNDHNTEPFDAPSPNAYDRGVAKGGQGISNHPLGAELEEQEKLASTPGKKPIASAKYALAIAVPMFLLAASAFAQSTVSCSAHGQARQFCRAETQNGVLLTQDHSHGACRYGSTWGFNARGIYVSGGCRADFLVNDGRNQHDQDGRSGRDGFGQNRQNDGGQAQDIRGAGNGNSADDAGNADRREHHPTIPAGTQIQVKLDNHVRAQATQ